MSYFDSFPIVKYPEFEDPYTFNYCVNIAARVVNKIKPIDDRSIYYEHILKEGESIENLCYNYYGSVFYYWTVLLLNNIFDINYDLPLNYSDFNDYIINKYGSYENAVNDTHYFIRPHESELEYVEVTSDLYDDYPVYSTDLTVPELSRGVQMKYTKSSYDIELEENEARRNIKLIQKQFVDEFVNLFIEQMNK